MIKDDLRARLVADIEHLRAVRDDLAQLARIALDETRPEAFEASASAVSHVRDGWRALQEAYRLLGVRPT